MKTAPLDSQILQGEAAALRVRTQGESWTPRAKQKDTVIVGEAVTQKVSLTSLPDSSPPAQEHTSLRTAQKSGSNRKR